VTSMQPLAAVLVLLLATLVGCEGGEERQQLQQRQQLEQRQPPSAAVCDRVASPGSRAVVERLVRSLDPGETGCLRGGKYQGAIKLTTRGAPTEPITLRSYPGEAARVIGRLWLTRASAYLVIRGLELNGRNRNSLPSPTVNGRHITFVDNDVTNDHTGICFVLGHRLYGTARDVTIRDNRIHDCGRLPPTNHDHGIYVSVARNTRIVGNRIYSNADHGVQMYPDAQRTYVARNVIDGNGEGVLFGGTADLAPRDNLVEHNVITNSRKRYNVESHFERGGAIGEGNVVRDNCIFGGARDDGSGGIAPQIGFEATGNITEPGRACRAVLLR
jgi:parallel beta-helix repeat protein